MEDGVKWVGLWRGVFVFKPDAEENGYCDDIQR